jgi:hypothetical protein
MPAVFVFLAITLQLVAEWAAKRQPAARAATYVALSAVVVTVGVFNLAHYVDWHSRPDTRRHRSPFVTTAEFPAWSAAVIANAEQRRGSFNVDQWRAANPLASDGAETPARAPVAEVLSLPTTPRSDWPPVVARFTSDGAAGLSQPRAVALDRAGNVYVIDADPQVQAVKKFTPSGELVLSWGRPGTSEGEFTGAWSIAIDAEDRVLVLDEESQWVQGCRCSTPRARSWPGGAGPKPVSSTREPSRSHPLAM